MRNKNKLRAISILSLLLIFTLFIPMEFDHPNRTLFKRGGTLLKPYESHIPDTTEVFTKWEIYLPYLMIGLSSILSLILSFFKQDKGSEILSASILGIALFWIVTQFITYFYTGSFLPLFIGLSALIWLILSLVKHNKTFPIVAISTCYLILFSLFICRNENHGFGFFFTISLIIINLGLILKTYINELKHKEEDITSDLRSIG